MSSIGNALLQTFWTENRKLQKDQEILAGIQGEIEEKWNDLREKAVGATTDGMLSVLANIPDFAGVVYIIGDGVSAAAEASFRAAHPGVAVHRV